MPSDRGQLAASQMFSALAGLTPEQRIKVRAHLPDELRDGWSIERTPTVGVPKNLRLIYRNREGQICQVITITENGVTK